MMIIGCLNCLNIFHIFLVKTNIKDELNSINNLLITEKFDF
jgi:hypothetical protein